MSVIEKELLMATVRKLMEESYVRIEKSFDKYGMNYIMADISDEVLQEDVDIVGWTSLGIARRRLLEAKAFLEFDDVYLDTFLKRQQPEYLKKLAAKIDKVLEEKKIS